MYGPPEVAVIIAADRLPDGFAVATIEDVSERRRLDAVRTDFVANTSHELKTPVGALAVLAEALTDEDDLVVVHRVADRMVSEAHRVARTIDDLMELSRIELGGDPVRDRVDVADVVSEAVERAAALAESRKIVVAALDLPDDVHVLGDRRQLSSALGNLVENAVKYSEPGASVQIRVRSHGGRAELMVADQGIGIPASEHSRIFERFYRVDKGRSRDTGGTGLGLSIVRHVATNHGGEVLVSSQEGEGSTFVLRVPLAPVTARRPSSPREGRSHLVTSPTVLVVEDEISFVEALTIGLKREGFRVAVANDGFAALGMFDDVRPDVVLLDVMLPGASGIDVCRQLRRKSQVPIIMVTAKSGEIDTVVGLEVGADDYVTKPYRIRELVARIRAVMRRTAAETGDEVAPGAVVVGDVVLDPDAHVLRLNGETVTVPLKEFELLHVLLANAGRVLTRETLIDRGVGERLRRRHQNPRRPRQTPAGQARGRPLAADPHHHHPRPGLQIRTQLTTGRFTTGLGEIPGRTAAEKSYANEILGHHPELWPVRGHSCPDFYQRTVERPGPPGDVPGTPSELFLFSISRSSVVGREVADGFDVVAVGIAEEGPVVVGVVLRPDPRFVEHLGGGVDSGREERVDCGTIGSREREVRFAKAVPGSLAAEPEVGHRRHSVPDGRPVELEDSLRADRGQHGVVERRTCFDVGALDGHMVEHGDIPPRTHTKSVGQE